MKNNHKFTLRQLSVFLSAAHYENLSKAAEHLSMSQSAASSALKDLEQQFDVQLFDRAGKRLKINELGVLLRPKAEALLAQADEIECLLRHHQDLGHLNVGATLTIGNYLCVGIMAEYMKQHEGTRVSLEVANTSEIVRKVERFELDIGLIEGELQHPDLDVVPWREDELVICCSPDHPLAQTQVLTDDDLLSIDWVIRESGSGTRQAFERAMSGLLSQLTIALELQHTEAIKRAVEANLGVGVLSHIAVKEAFARGTLVPLSAPHRHWIRHFYFVLHQQKFKTAGVNQWMTLCRQY